METPPSTEKNGPQKGDVIDGKLVIDGVLSEGRISTVVLAVDRDTQAKVAVKILRASDLESVERFRRSARAMTKLTSPYAVKVLRVGETASGSPCFVMEYLEGKTLAQRLVQGGGPLPIDDALRWIGQTCEAVADAHAQKLIHRDVDAENLFLALPPRGQTAAPAIRVLDFGLAPVWRLGKGDGRAKPGEVPGTSLALAPELARGSDLDERVDVWGIGACLYRLLSGRHVFTARNLAELCTRVLAERAPDVTKARPDVTPELAAIVNRCLQREPSDRYESVRELLAALDAVRDAAPDTPHVPTERATLEQLKSSAGTGASVGPNERTTIESLVAAAPAGSVVPVSLSDRKTLERVRAAEELGTPMMLRAAAPTDAEADADSDSSGDQTSVMKAPRHAEKVQRPAPVVGPPPDSDDDSSNDATGVMSALPRTLRTAPPAFDPSSVPPSIPPIMSLPLPSLGVNANPMSFGTLADQLDPPKRGPLPPVHTPPPPPMPSSSSTAPSPGDGPSTQPLGRLSPFADLPKAKEPERSPSSDDLTIAPLLVTMSPIVPLRKPSLETQQHETLSPSELPMFPALPRPSPQMQAQETIPHGELSPPGPPKPSAFIQAQTTLSPSEIPRALPKPSAAVQAQDTLQGPTAPPAPDQSARVPAAPHPGARVPADALVTGPPAPHRGPRVPADALVTGPPAPHGPRAPADALVTGPMASPRPWVTGPPPAMASGPAMAADEDAPAPEKRKSRAGIVLLFVVGIAFSVAAGLYLARWKAEQSAPKPRGPAVSSPVSAPVMPGATGATDPTVSTPEVTLPPEPAAGADSSSNSNEPPDPTPSATHHRKKPPTPKPSTTPSATPPPAHSVNVYEPF